MTVKVTNTGDVAGKEVVQIYCTAPYTIGGIEKAFVSLAGFDKTEILEPGASEEVVIEFTKEDLASYDDKCLYASNGGYVLESGTYEIKLMDNAHDLIEERTFDVKETVIYDDEHDGARSTDEVAATNQFQDITGDITYVSRADWEGTLPTEKIESREASEELIAEIEDDSVYNEDADPIVVADHGLSLEDMKGLDYDDPLWDDLLEQVSVDEMQQLIEYGGYQTSEVASVDAPTTSIIDGPAGLNGLVNGDSGVTYPTEVILASTWNVELVERMAECLGAEAAANGVSGVYAPGLNMHRSPFNGRNFEYFSEDSLLAGKMGAAYVRGLASKGVYCTVKHFVMCEQETNRTGACVWINEQAFREIYLKAFEIAIKEGNATGVMAADQRLGSRWTGYNSSLMNTVLRDEWGFDGYVVTDYCIDNIKIADLAIRSGTDLMLTTTGLSLTNETLSTNYGQQAMRRATHNILYTIANSDALEITYNSFPYWLLLVGLLNLLLIGGSFVIIYRIYRKRS